MTTSSFEIPSDYKYVAASLSLIPVFGLYLAWSVIQARKVSGVSLPALFASDEAALSDPQKKKFNCTQKAAMNFQEHAPNFVVATLVSGLTFPRSTAVAVVVWVIGRFFYHEGYSTGVPASRKKGFMGSVAHILTIGGALASAVSLICCTSKTT